MASKNSQSETIKEAVTAATRAISGNKELEINFGGMGSSLPHPPKTLKELSAYRGKADSLACVEKYRDKSVRIASNNEKVNSLIKVMEDSRVEILGSMNYPGIATNIKSKFDDKCKLYESFEDHEDHLEIALETWLRNLCLPNIESNNSSLFLKYWGKVFDNHETEFKERLKESLNDQSKFQEIAEDFLKSLNIDQEENEQEESDLEDENEQEEESASESGEDEESQESESSP